MRAIRRTPWTAASTSPTTPPTHSLCLAALRYHGFRAQNRYIVFQVLPHTLGLGPEVWRVLAKAHEIRNLGEYEGDLNVDDRIVSDVIAACRIIAVKLEALPPLE